MLYSAVNLARSEKQAKSQRREIFQLHYIVGKSDQFLKFGQNWLKT